MKVHGPASPLAATGRTARAATDGFAPEAADEADAPSNAVRPGSLSSVGSLEALLALQETDTPTERRRRAVRRAGRILDALDDLRIAVLDPDGPETPALHRLLGAVGEARDQTADPGLDDVLQEVELRAAVELAKREMRAAA